MKKVENSLSSISIKYPTYRDEFFKTSKRWLEGKRFDDNAEGLWRINDKLYDLENFTDRHPGGAEWLKLTKGVDITELYEIHHIGWKPDAILRKFYVRDASLARNYKLTFNDEGFYRTLKRKVAVKIREIDKRRPIRTSMTISDIVLVLVFVCAVLAVQQKSVCLASLTGIFLVWMWVIGHNFYHMKDNWRMLCFNLTLLDYREFRVSHVMSHHVYTNSYYDMEISLFEPLLQWIPRQKTRLQKIMSTVISPVVWLFIIPSAVLTRTFGYITNPQEFKLDHLVPFALPLTMFCLGEMNIFLVVKFWAIMIGVCSFLVGLIGLNAGHHHPDILHEGDQLEKSMDFGIFQLNCVIDRNDVKQSQFWTLVSFGHHALHHMFPTLDHGILRQLHETFVETCNEFRVELRTEISWWPLIVGQFQQLQRDRPKMITKPASASDATSKINDSHTLN